MVERFCRLLQNYLVCLCNLYVNFWLCVIYCQKSVISNSDISITYKQVPINVDSKIDELDHQTIMNVANKNFVVEIIRKWFLYVFYRIELIELILSKSSVKRLTLEFVRRIRYGLLHFPVVLDNNLLSFI